MKCHAKHIYNPEHWRCPKCGADGDGEFIIDEQDERAHEDCRDLHPLDWLVCEKCGWGGRGTTAARLWRKQDTKVVCSCCNGKGYVSQ